MQSAPAATCPMCRELPQATVADLLIKSASSQLYAVTHRVHSWHQSMGARALCGSGTSDRTAATICSMLTERRRIDDDDSYGAAVGDDRTDQLRLGYTAGADRVIANFAERGTKQGTPPLFRHYDQHARGKRCHDRPLSRQPTSDLERVLGVH